MHWRISCVLCRSVSENNESIFDLLDDRSVKHKRRGPWCRLMLLLMLKHQQRSVVVSLNSLGGSGSLLFGFWKSLKGRRTFRCIFLLRNVREWALAWSCLLIIYFFSAIPRTPSCKMPCDCTLCAQGGDQSLGFPPPFCADPSAVATETLARNNTLRYVWMLICLYAQAKIHRCPGSSCSASATFPSPSTLK